MKNLASGVRSTWLGFGPSEGRGKLGTHFFVSVCLARLSCHVMQDFVINIPCVNERSSDLRDLVSLTYE